ncbi:MAG: LemA family protein [Acidimicrobiales bacterium]
MQAALIVGGVAGAVLLAVALSYNRFVSQAQLVDNAWANVDTELRRRYDLVPNLVRTVEGYATHERAVLDSVVAARAQAAQSDGSVQEQVGPERTLVQSLKSLLALAEAYPDLKADAHFLELQQELAITEDRIQAARRLFNGNVRDYNQRVESVPSNLVARLAGFRRRDYFEVEPAVRDAGPPRVETA